MIGRRVAVLIVLSIWAVGAVWLSLDLLRWVLA